MGRRVRRTAFVPRAVLGTICAVTVVPAIVQACSSSGSAGYGNTDASPAGRGGTGNRAGSVGVAAGFGGLGVAAGFGGGGTGGRGGIGGTATGGTGGFSVFAGFGGTSATGGSGGSGGFTVAAGFGGTPDSGSDAPDAADAGPTDASGSASLDVNDGARFGELALLPNRRPAPMRGRRRQSGKRRRQRRRS